MRFYLQALEKSYQSLEDPSTIFLTEEEFWA